MPDSLAELLHRFRSVARLSQESLAERAGLSTRTVSDIETGFAKTPRLVTIVLLAEALALNEADRARFAESARKTPAGAPAHDGAAAPLPFASPLVGRDADATATGSMLVRPEIRLLTLCGPAGVGKTSLALRIAHEGRERFTAGAAFVELAQSRIRRSYRMPSRGRWAFATAARSRANPSSHGCARASSYWCSTTWNI